MSDRIKMTMCKECKFCDPHDEPSIDDAVRGFCRRSAPQAGSFPIVICEVLNSEFGMRPDGCWEGDDGS